MAAASLVPALAPALTSAPRAWTYCDLIKDMLTSEENIMYWILWKISWPHRWTVQSVHPAVEWSNIRAHFLGCQAVVSARDKSLFNKSKLSFATVPKLMYLWNRQNRVTEAAAEAMVSNRVAGSTFSDSLLNPLPSGALAQLWRSMNRNSANRNTTVVVP